MIEFANPRIRAIDHLADIIKAAKHASANLYCRYRILLDVPWATEDGKVVVEMEVPDIFAKNIGNRLRGISIYLLKNRGEYYDQFRIGKRLLFYIDIPSKLKKETDIL